MALFIRDIFNVFSRGYRFATACTGVVAGMSTMIFRTCGIVVSLAAVLAASACSKSTPAAPSATAAATTAPTADPSLTASVATPRPLTPANGAAIANLAQPVTLVVQNAIVTKPGGTTYTFEVATDAAFTAKLQTKDAVAEGSGGQTSVKLDALDAAKDYYWHARATAGGTTGVFGAVYKFTIGPAISINAPVPIAPINGAATGARPALRATNATRTGPAGPISYRFEISTSSTFSSIIVSATNSEGVNETGYVPTADLPINATLFWRVTAIDSANAISSPASTVQSFVTSLTIDLTKVVYLKGPNLSTWRQTGKIISVEQDGNPGAGGPMCISFTDPGWPDAKWIYGGDDPNFGIYGNQWYFANIGGTWYGGPGEWLYRGAAVCKAGQGTRTIGPDSGFGQPFSSWVPKPGELVGYAVSASARALPAMSTVQERTDVVVVPWRDSSLQAFTGQAIQFKR